MWIICTRQLRRAACSETQVHALVQQERRYSGGVETSACRPIWDVNCPSGPSPRKAAVWAKPTVFISAVCSAGLKKQENWSDNTRNEPAEARSIRKQTGEHWSRSWLRFLETRETPAYGSCASLA